MQRMMNVVISDETPTTKMKPEPVGVMPSHPHTSRYNKIDVVFGWNKKVLPRFF